MPGFNPSLTGTVSKKGKYVGFEAPSTVTEDRSLLAFNTM
jgi:hypothetical protein